MSRIPKIAKEYIDRLNEYKDVEDLVDFNICHLYPSKVFCATNNGYVDSKYFDLVIYDSFNMRRRRINRRVDGLLFRGAEIDIARIYADGSTLLRFKGFHTIDEGQACFITPKQKEAE